MDWSEPPEPMNVQPVERDDMAQTWIV